jgi:hypothetical protein
LRYSLLTPKVLAVAEIIQHPTDPEVVDFYLLRQPYLVRQLYSVDTPPSSPTVLVFGMMAIWFMEK